MGSLKLVDRAALVEEFSHCEALRVTGDANAPALNTGDWALIDLKHTRFTIDARYAVMLWDTVEVRWLYWLPDGRLRMACANLAYPAYEVDRDQLQIVGRVVGTIKRC